MTPAPPDSVPATLAAPRALTQAARRRAWIEPHVRFWWMVAAALGLAAVYLLISHYRVWRSDSYLVTSGVPIQATLTEANGSTLKGKTEQADSAVRLEYAYKGQTYKVWAPSLEGRGRNDALIVGDSIPIRIDPSSPGRWTGRARPFPLAQELIGGLIALGAAIVFLVLGLWRRSAVLRTWRHATAIPALVLSARHTALAPRAWLARCTPADAGDSRVFSVFLPPGSDVSEGAGIWVLVPNTGQPLAAGWLQ